MSEHHREPDIHHVDPHEHSGGPIKRQRVEGDVKMGKTLRLRGGKLVTAGRRLLGVAALTATGLGAYELGTPGKSMEGAYNKAREFVFTKDYVASQLFEILKIENKDVASGAKKEIGMETLGTAFESAGITGSKFENEAEWRDVLTKVNEKYAEYKAELRTSKVEATPTATESRIEPSARDAAKAAPPRLAETARRASKPEASPAQAAPEPVPAAPATAPTESESKKLVATTGFEKEVKTKIIEIFNEKMKKGLWGPAKADYQELRKRIVAKIKELKEEEAIKYLRDVSLTTVDKAIAKCNEKMQ